MSSETSTTDSDSDDGDEVDSGAKQFLWATDKSYGYTKGRFLSVTFPPGRY